MKVIPEHAAPCAGSAPVDRNFKVYSEGVLSAKCKVRLLVQHHQFTNKTVGVSGSDAGDELHPSYEMLFSSVLGNNGVKVFVRSDNEANDNNDDDSDNDDDNNDDNNEDDDNDNDNDDDDHQDTTTTTTMTT